MSRLSGQQHRPVTADAVMSSSFHGVTTSTNHNNDHNQLLDMTKSLIENFTSDSIMTQSLDPTILGNSSMNTSMNTSMTSSIMIRDSNPSPTNNGNLYNEQSHIPMLNTSGPLVTASKMMPVPESLMSPDCGPSSVIPAVQQAIPRPLSGLTTSASNTTPTGRTTKVTLQQRPSSSPAAVKSSSRIAAAKKQDKISPSNSPRKAIVNTANTKIHQNQTILKNSTQQQQKSHEVHRNHQNVATDKALAAEEEAEDECDRANAEKIKSTKKLPHKNQKQLENNHQVNKVAVENKEAEKSAIVIQKIWRGYNTRKQNVGDIANALQQKRTNDYILKLTQDMEMTKQALENERKIQQLQMQAINALWKKVSSMQGAESVVLPGENGATSSSKEESSNIVHDLTKTCSVLTNQVRKISKG